MADRIPTLLVIEDEDTLRESVTDFFEDRGFRVLAACNGKAGLAVFGDEKPDLVLTDLRMPGADGFAILERVRKDAPETPVVVISGAGTVSDSVRALRLGAWDYIVKPVEDMSIILHAIEKCLERARLLRENRLYQENLERLVHERTADLERVNAELFAINTRLRCVVDSTRKLSGCSCLSEVGVTMLEEFVSHMGAEGGSLFLVQEKGLRLLHTIRTGAVPDFIPYPLSEKSVLRRLVQKRAPLLIEDIDREKDLECSGWAGYRDGSTLGLPILDEAGELVGVVTLHSKVPPCFIQQDKEIATILASFSCETLRATRSNELLRASERRFRELVDMLPESVFESDTEMNLVFANMRALDLFGYTPDDLKAGLRCWDMLPPEEVRRAQKNMREWEREAEPTGRMREYTARRKDGSAFPILLHVTSILDDGEVAGFRGVIVDISERKATEEALRESEERFRALAEESADVIMRFDRDLRHLYVNPAVEKQTGIPHLEFIGKTHEEMGFPEDLCKQWEGVLHRVFETNEPQRLEFQLPTGAWIDWLLMPEHASDGSVKAVISAARDISERKTVEKDRERLMQAIEQVGEMVMILDSSRHIQYVNAAYEKTTGWSRSEVVGKHVDDLERRQPSEVDISSMARAMKRGEAWRGQMVQERKDGTSYREEALISPVMDAGGDIVNYVAVMRDVTDEMRMEEQLRQSQKMESVGKLAGGVAHDFNNMLSVILGYVQMALDDTEPSNTIHPYLEQIQIAGQRSTDLTRQLLAFARQQTVSPKVLDLNTTVGSMLKMLQRLIGEDIDLVWTAGGGLWPVKMDPGQVDQILANLCVNARDAISGVGKVTIETRNATLDAAHCSGHAGGVCAPGDYVELTVTDNGCGMDAEVLQQMYEPFFTTKELGKGTGLGLSTVYGIVQQNRGHIQARSKLGKGASFQVYLPRHVGDPGEAQATSDATVDIRGDETILLVEDQPALLELTETILQRFGYRVLAAATPVEALDLAERHAADIQLLLTDVVMPQMNGRELAEELQVRHPGLKILFMSGYTTDVIADHGVLEGDVQLLEKPFTATSLAAKVREVLDRRS